MRAFTSAAIDLKVCPAFTAAGTETRNSARWRIIAWCSALRPKQNENEVSTRKPSKMGEASKITESPPRTARALGKNWPTGQAPGNAVRSQNSTTGR